MDDWKPMIVWKVKTRGYNVLWESFTWAIADWLELRSWVGTMVWVYPKIISKHRYCTMEEFSGH